MSDDLVERAERFARGARDRIQQRHKYSLDPQDVHLGDVARLVGSVSDDPEMIAAAWLHDIVEDTEVTLDEIEREFGPGVAYLVAELTGVSRPSDGDRYVRKAIDLKHAATVSARAKTVRLADLIDNARDLDRHAPHLARFYLSEMSSLLDVLGSGDPVLYAKARQALEAHQRRLEPSESAGSDPIADMSAAEAAPFSRQHGIRLFTQAFTALDILEPLVSHDRETLTAAWPPSRGDTVIGVRDGGRIVGYLVPARQSPEIRTISPRQVLDIDAPMVDVVHVLTNFSFCFITLHGEVTGVIQRIDTEKPVVRMWLFGMIILIEMVVVESIHRLWPGEAWTHLVSEGRLRKARELLEEKRRRNVPGDLLDCLQFADKMQLSIHAPGFLDTSGLPSMAAAKRVFKDMEMLRNDLAHGQEISTRNWASIVRLTRRMNDLLRR